MEGGKLIVVIESCNHKIIWSSRFMIMRNFEKSPSKFCSISTISLINFELITCVACMAPPFHSLLPLTFLHSSPSHRPIPAGNPSLSPEFLHPHQRLAYSPEKYHVFIKIELFLNATKNKLLSTKTHKLSNIT